MRSRDADRHQRGRRVEPQLPGETTKLECFVTLNIYFILILKELDLLDCITFKTKYVLLIEIDTQGVRGVRYSLNQYPLIEKSNQ